MERRLFKVEDQFCDECALPSEGSLAIGRGIESIDVEHRMIAVLFNPG
jgi:hypothetical protein